MNNFIKCFVSNDEGILIIFQINEIMICGLFEKSIEFSTNSIIKRIQYFGTAVERTVNKVNKLLNSQGL